VHHADNTALACALQSIQGGRNTCIQHRRHPKEITMRIYTTRAAIAAATALLTLTACVVSPTGETQSIHLDDAGITLQVKSRFLDSPEVDGRAISVETLHGTVLLSGVATTPLEKAAASEIALGVAGVRLVQNEITIRQ
jgi:hyperosmotically inducible periplasmic protein